MDRDIDKMKARFHFICKNKMKADFCFMKSAKRLRATRAVATCCKIFSLRSRVLCGFASEEKRRQVAALQSASRHLRAIRGSFPIHA
jgi:hypothetical protein